MPDISRIGGRPNASSRAGDAWARIMDKPTAIIIVRGSTVLPVQTMRIEYGDDQREIAGGGGISARRLATLFGIYDHPMLPDTDLRRDDRFAADGVQFKILDIVLTLGEKQARAEVVS